LFVIKAYKESSSQQETEEYYRETCHRYKAATGISDFVSHGPN